MSPVPTPPMKVLPKVGSGSWPFERQYSRCKVGGKESLLYFGGRQLGRGGVGRVDLCPKAESPLTIRGQKLSKGSFRGTQAEGGG